MNVPITKNKLVKRIDTKYKGASWSFLFSSIGWFFEVKTCENYRLGIALKTSGASWLLLSCFEACSSVVRAGVLNHLGRSLKSALKTVKIRSCLFSSKRQAILPLGSTAMSL